MKYPKYAKIYFEDEEWYAKLKGKDYIQEGIAWQCNEDKINPIFTVCESYPLEDLKDSKLKYEEITEYQYKEAIKRKIITDYEEQIKSFNQQIDNIQKEKEKVLELL